MSAKATITVLRPREELERLWQGPERPDFIDEVDGAVTFRDAPGDRGTEIHVDLDKSAPGGKLGEMAQKLTGSDPRAKVMDALRRFKQVIETGEVTRSDGAPEGEAVERKFKQRPAQPLDESEIEKAGV